MGKCLCSSQLWFKQKLIVSVCAYPQEGIQRTVLHEFSDDEHRAAPRQDALQPDHVGMVKLTHDGRLCQEVAPLALRVARLQRLDCHHHLPATGLLETAAAHLAKFPWSEMTKWQEEEGGARMMWEGLSEERRKDRGVEGKRARGGCRERERYWLDSGVTELI